MLHKIMLVGLLFISTISFAQKTMKVGKQQIEVPGSLVSSIELVNFNNKNIGWLNTYTSLEKTTATFTYVYSEAGKPYIITKQIINKKDVAGMNQEIEVKKAFVDSEMKTNPKKYWSVSVSFRLANNDAAEVGTTIDVRDGGGKNEYKGTSYLVPFKDKKNALAFAEGLKKMLGY